MEFSSYAAVTPIRKLKDSCDLCSSSKVRCDKTKPACSRCVSLGHPCSYSPARRAGRPHRIHTQSKNSHPPSLAGESRPSDPTNIRNSSPLTSGLSVLDDSAFFGTQAQTSSHSINNQQQPQHIQEQPAEAPCRTRSASGSDTEAFDCFSAATSTLEQLEIARQKSDFTHSISAVTEACQRLLTILICPCSERSLVALLLACGCISLMNTARDLSRTCSPQNKGTSRRSSGGTTPTARSGTDNSDLDYFATFNCWPMPLSSSSSYAGLVGSNGKFGVEELARIAKVISHFTERYRQGPQGGTPRAGWAHTTWLLEPLVASLRLRLQSVTLEVTERLVL